MSQAADIVLPNEGDALTALVIDDEPLIRRVIRQVLEPDFCRVMEAANGEEGLGIIQRESPHIDFVLTDLKMPGLDGWDVVDVLAQYRPELPIGVISGYDADNLRAGGLGIRYLAKPFLPDSLASLAANLVANARAARARAEAQCARAQRAHANTAQLAQQNAELRAKTDLISAAWARHRSQSP